VSTAARFRAAYAEHRADEGRGSGGLPELLALPYVRHGALAHQWRVRARTFGRFLRAVVGPRERTVPLRVLDLGAGNGWLCYRLALRGHTCVAVDWRRDTVDGLGAGAPYLERLARGFARVAASFDALPLRALFDLVVFNAAIHYATSLETTLAEAVCVTRPGGQVVILDSPFYRRAQDGERMVAEKRGAAARAWGPHAEVLLALPIIEYLTGERLAAASAGFNLRWRRHRVRYPWWYEARPLVARLRGRRAPSRFDLWEATVPAG
jgi:SAM-dependent methyltransferase